MVQWFVFWSFSVKNKMFEFNRINDIALYILYAHFMEQFVFTHISLTFLLL